MHSNGLAILAYIVGDIFLYKCTDYYHPEDEGTVIWNDPAIGIDWPLTEVSLSQKDSAAPSLADISPDLLPKYIA